MEFSQPAKDSREYRVLEALCSVHRAPTTRAVHVIGESACHSRRSLP